MSGNVQPWGRAPTGKALGDLTHSELRVLIAISSFQGDKKECYPGREKICERAGWPVTRSNLNRVSACTGSLERNGLIRKTRRGKKRSNIYCVVWADAHESCASTQGSDADGLSGSEAHRRKAGKARPEDASVRKEHLKQQKKRPPRRAERSAWEGSRAQRRDEPIPLLEAALAFADVCRPSPRKMLPPSPIQQLRQEVTNARAAGDDARVRMLNLQMVALERGVPNG